MQRNTPDRRPEDDRLDLVLGYCERAGLRLDQVIWCDFCHLPAPTVDDHIQHRFDAAGFVGDLCPTCGELAVLVIERVQS